MSDEERADRIAAIRRELDALSAQREHIRWKYDQTTKRYAATLAGLNAAMQRNVADMNRLITKLEEVTRP